MQDLKAINIRDFPHRHTQNAVSPFRYPGGKGFLSGFLADHLAKCFDDSRITFLEPFCGGAGAAVNLLADGYVDCLHLNDADVRIYSAWRAMLSENERFIERIQSVPLTMDEWHVQSRISTDKTSSNYDFDLGFASFYLNRTTRSGIVSKAGPIGGYDQTGKWKIDARFNREGLSQRVRWIGENSDRIKISNLDVLPFLDRSRRTLDPNSSFYFIDPPYVKAGDRLYLNAMGEDKHVALSDMLTSGRMTKWVLSYDDHPLIRQVYSDQNMRSIAVNYSLQKKRKEAEILITPSSSRYESASVR
ncbi:DNA adenine methylase [Litoreibacter roseus]|uniref:DNA methyltransferase n=1 Tax=Litoreibacter roseus TaxID=2601869 RepID=A0A6N6JE11_9RHOB|nr:DNA adenine methylase [Litoreibacter roseus]GFE64365.1 DNA methyltransferase [Litoreibacter roseus]